MAEDLTALAQKLARTGAILVEPRIVRRVIRKHRSLRGLGLAAPHGHCYTLPHAALLPLASPAELGLHAAADLPDEPILLPRPETHAGDAPEALLPWWRLIFHAHVHQEMARRKLSPSLIRDRVHRIGQAEFDEIRYVLKQDDLLLPPADDVETYAEFAAVYLELERFAPASLARTFPTIQSVAAIDKILALDLDADAILERSRPEGAPASPQPATAPEVGQAAAIASATRRPDTNKSGSRTAISPELTASADRARQKGNLVRSAVVRRRAGDVEGARRDLETLVEKLEKGPFPRAPAASSEAEDLTAALFPLVEIAAAGSTLRRTVEMRLLYDLQKAVVDHEREVGTVDVMSFLTSLGKKPITRSLPAGREVRTARHVHEAAAKLGALALPEPQRARLAEVIHEAAERCDARVRDVLRPRLEAALDEVNLVARDLPERVARKKLIDELLDQVVGHGFLSIGHLRDAISRNQLKLGDVAGPMEMFRGDALLKADKRLSYTLDGVYRRGEIYLRGLQKLSSLFFGTPIGRVITLYLILPALIPFTLLKGVAEIGGLAGKIFFHAEPEIYSIPRLIALAVVTFLLLHVGVVRHAAGAGLRGLGKGLRFVFYVIPRAFWHLPFVQLIARSRPAVLFGRYILKPAIFAAIFVAVAAALGWSRREMLIVGGIAEAVFSLIMNTRPGAVAEEIVADWTARSFRHLGTRILPGLFHLIVEVFKIVMEAIDRLIYGVDEFLRFRKGESQASLFVKGVLGFFWFFVTYILRIYLNLLIEPTINPVKHFPVVTVSAKIMLPLQFKMSHAVREVIRPFLRKAAGPIAGTTVFLLPGVFGFLAWELKENWKLYRANRPAALKAVSIGHHGETMGGFMKPGFHSGTIPKLYAKLRRAAWKGDLSAARHREALHHVEEAIWRFADRELCALLAESPAWKPPAPLSIGHVECSSNRVRLELLLGEDHHHAARIAFEEQSGWLLAALVAPGWITHLPRRQLALFEAALAGFYKLAGVDMVREQVERALPGTPAPPYDIADEGLVIWPDPDYKTEIVYDLHKPQPLLAPLVRGEEPASAPAALEARTLLFVRQPVLWTSWVDAWGRDEPPRIIDGPPILPPAADEEREAVEASG